MIIFFVEVMYRAQEWCLHCDFAQTLEEEMHMTTESPKTVVES